MNTAITQTSVTLKANKVLQGSPVQSKGPSATVGRSSRLQVCNSVKLSCTPMTTAEKISSMSYQYGYLGFSPSDIEFTKDALVIGADTQPGSTVDVILPVPTISGVHARVLGCADSVMVTDLDSTNGTYVDGVKLTPNKPKVANPGSVVAFDVDKSSCTYTVTLLAAEV
ncbi:hypothetical protein CYMTET_32897, partial [Cymbomonas tetramitiformis]